MRVYVCEYALQLYQSQGLDKPRLVLTIHNLDNTGECRQDEFYYAGLAGEPFATVRLSISYPSERCYR